MRYAFGLVLAACLTLTQPPALPGVLARAGEYAARYQTLGGVTAWVIGYAETRGPTFFASVGGRQVPMSGEVWIDPRNGEVVRTSLSVDSSRLLPAKTVRAAQPAGARWPQAADAMGFSRMSVEVTYTFEPNLTMWVPVELKEFYDRDDPTAGSSTDGAPPTYYLSYRLSCTAKYTNFRRLGTGAAGRPVSTRPRPNHPSAAAVQPAPERLEQELHRNLRLPG